MKKTLLLVRHSKAENRNNIVNDIERPLSDEGIADSKKMGNLLLNSGIKPEMVLASSATRNIHTAQIFSGILKIPEKDVIVSGNLYYSSAKTILDHIYGLPDAINCVMVVAHNPGISDLARELSSGRVTFMVNTQILIMEYDIDHWYQFGEQKPMSFLVHRPGGKSQ
jgi:phosphohistidine phosphatase